jgi:polyferredoxin
MSDGVNRFLGDTPARVLIKLVLISLVVGVVMSAFHWTPYDILYGIRDFFLRLWNMGFSAIAGFDDYSNPWRGSRHSCLYFAPYPQLPEMKSIR